MIMSFDTRDQERVNAAYTEGTKNFTQDDLDEVFKKSDVAESKGGKLGNVAEEFKLLWNLLKDYKAGVYTEVPWKLIAAIGFAVAYLISPIDVIPDFIPVAGLLDDAGVFGLVIAGFASEIEAYKAWKNKQ